MALTTIPKIRVEYWEAKINRRDVQPVGTKLSSDQAGFASKAAIASTDRLVLTQFYEAY